MTSNFLNNRNDWGIVIPQTLDEDGVTMFCICVRVGNVKWTVQRRYREFAGLHKELVSNHGVSKDILPPKVFLKKMSSEILNARREGLQKYINIVLTFLSNAMPPILVDFLMFDKYDMWFLFRNLADCIKRNHWIESSSNDLRMSVIEVSALFERLKLPCPPVEIIDSQSDFCTILEFVSSAKNILIYGENKECFGTSNINYKKIPFDLSAFKSLADIRFCKIFMGNLIRADEMRHQIASLKVRCSNLKEIADALLCDNIHKDWKQATSGQMWSKLLTVDMSHNMIAHIDSGLELMPNTNNLNLSFNLLKNLNAIGKLQNLKVLDLSHNKISLIESTDNFLPNLKYLDLSNNEIVTIKGINQFPALETLKLSFNLIEDFNEISYICDLKEIINIVLVGNPISQKTDYRVKTLGKFGKRTPEICLDNELSTASELELITLVQTLKFVQEGRSLTFNKDLSLNI